MNTEEFLGRKELDFARGVLTSASSPPFESQAVVVIFSPKDGGITAFPSGETEHAIQRVLKEVKQELAGLSFLWMTPRIGFPCADCLNSLLEVCSEDTPFFVVRADNEAVVMKTTLGGLIRAKEKAEEKNKK